MVVGRAEDTGSKDVLNLLNNLRAHDTPVMFVENDSHPVGALTFEFTHAEKGLANINTQRNNLQLLIHCRSHGMINKLQEVAR